MSSSSDEAKKSKFDYIWKVNRGEIIIVEEQIVTDLYLIKRGRVKVIRENGGRIIPITVLRANAFICETDIFAANQRSSITAIAAENTELVKISKEDIQKAMGESAEWVQKIMCTLADRQKSCYDIIKEHKILTSNKEEQLTITVEEEYEIKEAIAIYKDKAELA